MSGEGEDGRGTSGDLGMPRIEDNTLALRFESYPGDPSFLEAFLTPRFVDAACIILVISFTSIQI